MKFITLATLPALALIASTSSALAWQNTSNPYPWDKGCDKYNCYEPYTAYQHGHYSRLTCKDPYKYLTYVDGHLACVPRMNVAK